MPRHLPYRDDAHAPPVGRDDEAVGHVLPREAHAPPVPSRRRARRLLQEPLHVHAPLAVPPEDRSPDAIVIEHDLLHRAWGECDRRAGLRVIPPVQLPRMAKVLGVHLLRALHSAERKYLR